MYFLAKKVILSEGGGETNVVSVIGGLCKVRPYILSPFNEGTDTLLWTIRMDHYCPFVVETSHMVVKCGRDMITNVSP
jgi:hypothetical protein